MRILLDTQIVLSVLTDGSILTNLERELIRDSENEVICSSISIFEISLKYSIGKLTLNNLTPDRISDLLLKSGYAITDISHHTAASFYKLPVQIHKDPFDRILIWEAIQNDYVLMTHDADIRKYREYGLRVVGEDVPGSKP